MIACPGLEVFGIDVSEYALTNCEKEIVGRLHLGSALSLPFPDNSFDLVLAINSIHNLSRDGVKTALMEINRVGIGKAFIQVDAYRSEDEKELFEQWVLTAEYHDYPENWISLFKEAGYAGDYNWTILEG
jgi:ubiquinone/menaquinone biosynthesis C-methylase UbiE